MAEVVEVVEKAVAVTQGLTNFTKMLKALDYMEQSWLTQLFNVA